MAVLSRASYDSATRTVQHALRLAGAIDLVADGKFGRYTTDAYNAASGLVKEQLIAILAGSGLTVDDLKQFRATQRAKEVDVKPTGDNWISETKIHAAIDRASRELGLSDDLRRILKEFVLIESAQEVRGGMRYYDALSKNGQSLGIGQLQPAAWTDARLVLTDLPTYQVGVYDYVQNIRAMAAYVVVLIRRYGASAESLDEIYVAYNQGPGVLSGIITGFDGQSERARKMVKRVVTKRRLVPRFRDTPKAGHKLWDKTPV